MMITRRFRRAASVVILALPLTLSLVACGSDSSSSDTTVATADTEAAAPADATETTAAAAAEAAPAGEGCPPADGSAAQKRTFSTQQPMCIDQAKTYTATMVTDKGTMVFELLDDKAPKTVNNFVVLARYHYFDGIIFHRVVPDFVLQGGDPDGNGTGGPGYDFEDELPAAGEYKIGSLAMANRGPDTNGSQFFVISGDNGAQLPPNYSLFGQLTEGTETMEAIAALAEGDGPPREQVTITSVTIAES